MKNKAIIFLLCFLTVLCCGCGNQNNVEESSQVNISDDNRDKDSGKESIEQDYNSNLTTDEDIQAKYDSSRFDKVEIFGEIGEPMQVRSFTSEGEVSYGNICNTVEQVYVSKLLEYDLEEWTSFEIELLQVEEGEIKNEYSIIYIKGKLSNLSNETFDYYLSETGVERLEGEYLYQAVGELGYSDLFGTGKKAYRCTLLPQEEKSYVIAYVIEDKYIDNLYINLADGSSDSSEFILIPFEEN